MEITGTSKSRLNDLKKYDVNTDFFGGYFLSTGSAINGVNQNLSDLTSNPQKIVYYIDNITYTDLISDDDSVTTTFKFVGAGYNSPDFIDKPIYKDPNKSNIISNPKINNDVFIIRQDISVFDKIYKLDNIFNLIELETYVSGKYFNIINNT